MASDWTQEELQDWFEECKLSYHLSHTFNTLSGNHFVFHSQILRGNRKISVEMFANKYEGLQSGICMIIGEKAIPPVIFFDISEDDGIEKWTKYISKMEDNLLK